MKEYNNRWNKPLVNPGFTMAEYEDSLKSHNNGDCPDDGDFCPDCCEHVEHDHGICLYCETDITDDLVGQAEYL